MSTACQNGFYILSVGSFAKTLFFGQAILVFLYGGGNYDLFIVLPTDLKFRCGKIIILFNAGFYVSCRYGKNFTLTS